MFAEFHLLIIQDTELKAESGVLDSLELVII